MNKQHFKDLRTLARSIAGDTRRLKKAVNVIQALDGFTGDGGGEMEAAAHTELAAAAAALRASLDRIATVMAAVEPANAEFPF